MNVLALRWKKLEAENEKDAFEKIIHMFPRTEESLIDLRYFPFGSEKTRNSLNDFSFKNCDFSFSSFKNCNFFKMKFYKCKFNMCDFSELRQWNSEFSDCEFTKCDFRNATLGVGCKYDECLFLQSRLSGKSFGFGVGSKFSQCNFVKCKIQSAYIHSAIFKNCRFESAFISVRFEGKKISDIYKQDDKRAHTLKIVSCDFSGSSFRNVEIFDDIIAKAVKWPSVQSVSDLNGRMYYE